MLKSVLTFLIGVLVGANLVYFAMTRDREPAAAAAPSQVTTPPAPASAPEAPPVAGIAGPDRRPDATGGTSPRPVAPVPPSSVVIAPTGLALPLPNLKPGQLLDTFDQARGGERRHEALDIMAPAGTPVLAVADGHIEKLFTSDAGGLTLYQFEPTGRYAYYYAHLQAYAPGVTEARPVKRGEVIGYVGSTGNANPAAPHLHFAVFELGPERKWWQGTPINPYPLLGGLPMPPAP